MNRLLWEPLVRAALLEDLGRAGDVTTDAIVADHTTTTALVVAREDGVVAGLAMAAATFTLYDAGVSVEPAAADGDLVEAGTVLATVQGSARAVLTAERTCLNLLGHLSGIATATRGVVDLVSPHGAAVVDTRKTTPGLRTLEKWAVRMGGGSNHRFGLDDAVLIKDNHIAVAGGVAEAVGRVRARAGHLVKIEVEVDTLEQLDEVLGLDADAVLLDNFTLDDLRAGVTRVRDLETRSGRRLLVEASGGIRPETAEAIAATGVDLLSMGWLTNSSPNLDVALDIVVEGDAQPSTSAAASSAMRSGS
jgi:nicotinate-nucleotide pyrophosphorylase (carboxylating)